MKQTLPDRVSPGKHCRFIRKLPPLLCLAASLLFVAPTRAYVDENGVEYPDDDQRIPIEGKIILKETDFEFNNYYIEPEFELEGMVADLSPWNDYIISYEDNFQAGIATVRITGEGKYNGEIKANFTIRKAQMSEEWYSADFPGDDTIYDKNPHNASLYLPGGVGDFTIYYENTTLGKISTEAPVSPGTYNVYLQTEEGANFLPMERTKIGEFTIYSIDQEDMMTILALLKELSLNNDLSDYADFYKDPSSLISTGRISFSKGKVKMINLESMDLKGPLPLSAFKFKDAEEIILHYNNFSGKVDDLTVLKDNQESLASVKRLWLAWNQLEGNAGVFSMFPNIELLTLDNNRISDLYPSLPVTINDLRIFSQHIDRTITVDLANPDFAAMAKQIPSIALYDHFNQSYGPEDKGVTLSDSTGWYASTWFPENLDLPNGLQFYSGNGDLPYKGENGDICEICIDPNSTYMKARLLFLQGDANFSTRVDILDLQSIVNFILHNHYYYSEAFNFTAANLNEDDVVNVQDAVILVNGLLDGTYSPASAPLKAPTLAEASDAEARIFFRDGALFIDSDKEIAAIDLTIPDPNSAVETIPGMSVASRAKDGMTRIIIYSPTGMTIPAGVTKIATTSASSVNGAMLSDPSAKEIKAASGETSTGIEAIPSTRSVSISAEGIEVHAASDTPASWTVTTPDGKLLSQGTANPELGGLFIPLSTEIGTIYLVRIVSAGSETFHKLTRIR